MPSQFPPFSTRRQSDRSNRNGQNSRNSRSPRQSRQDREVRHRPFAGEQQRREKHSRRHVLRGHLVAMSGELVGTILFLWFAFAGTQVAAMSTPAGTVLEPQGIVYISLSFGMSLLVVAWAFYRISGGLFNPAVTIGMMATQTLPFVRGLCLIPCQIVGGIIAAALVSCMFPGPLAVVTTLTAGTSIAQGVFIEMFLTALLVFVILMLAAEKHQATFIAPVGIGLALFVAELAGVYFTGGSLNPARSFGPSVISGQFPGYHWIYWLGPIMGGFLAGGYYKFVKFFEYEEVNPGQDAGTEREKTRSTERSDAV